MLFKCSLFNYLWISDSRCWVNSISGLYSFLLHKLEKSVYTLRGYEQAYLQYATSDNIACYHMLGRIYSICSRKKAFFKYYNTTETLFFLDICVYAEYVFYTKLIYKYNILAQKTVFEHLTSNYF